MPFNYSEYCAYCKRISDEGLQQDYQKYIRILGSSSASTGISTALAFFTFGLSLVGTVAGGAAATNAIKKTDIIEAECARRGISPNFRKRDFFKGYGVGCTVGAVTHGAGGHLVDSVVNHAASHAFQHTAQHAHTSLTSIEHGADKLASKGSEALEKRAYGSKVLSRELTEVEKYGDSMFP